MPRNPSADTGPEQILRSLDHDLRSPVANILGFVDLVREAPGGTLTTEQLEFVARIEDNCRTLLAMLERVAQGRSTDRE